jgi:hypothetical protein
MKKLFLLTLVLIIAALSVMSVSAAPRGRYYDQMGNKYWCNVDSYGCWVTNENGGKDYIMFWSEASAEAIMGPNSGAPIGTNPGTQELPLQAPKPANVAKAGLKGKTCESWEEKQADGSCKQVKCSDEQVAVCEKDWAERKCQKTEAMFNKENGSCYCWANGCEKKDDDKEDPKPITCESWEEKQDDGSCKQVKCSDAQVAACEADYARRQCSRTDPTWTGSSCYCWANGCKYQ